jgi:Arc/MetJ family transcription regulator
MHILMRPRKEAAMRTTVTLDDELLERAEKLTGIRERPALLREALKALIAREAAIRLARLGGSDPDATAARRYRQLAEDGPPDLDPQD